jgi:hypothetical protein
MGTFQPNIQKDNGMDAEGYHTYLASINDNQTYPIKYKISSGAVIEAISSETPPPILNIIVREVPQGGNLTIQLPTKLLGLYSAGGYSVAEGTMCAEIGDKSFPTPIASNLNFTTVEFPLMNYSGVDEVIYITGNSQQPSTTSEFPPPLKQFKSGIPTENVQCNQGFQKILKREDASTACVKPDTANILVERGWAEPIMGRITQTSNMLNTKNHDPFGITALVIYHPSLGCLGPPGNATFGCPPNNFYLQINSNSTAYLLGYNICDASSCAKNNTLSVLLPINTILKPNYQMIGLPVNLKWKDGETVSIQLRISPTDNETGLLIDYGNSTIVP